MKAWCLRCNKETQILIDRTISKKNELLYKGQCKECGEYLCKIIFKPEESQ